MLGDVVQLKNNLWLIEGEMPEDSMKAPDPCNVLLYRADDRLYMVDSGVGPDMRQSIIRLLQEIGPVRSFTLLNSHSHLEHICNNDLLRRAQAQEKHHFLSESGLSQLDAPDFFADNFIKLDQYYDPLTGYQSSRSKFRILRLFRDILSLFIGQRRVLKFFMSKIFEKFEPVYDSRDTIQLFETLPKKVLRLDQVTWSGWVFGPNDLWALEERGHSPDEMLFYIPEHCLLHMSDATFTFFPAWPNSDSANTREALRKSLALVQAGKVDILTDSHHHQVYRSKAEIITFLETLLSDHERFRELLNELLQEQDGLTISEIYGRLKHRQEPLVQKYLTLEFPHSPPALQNVIVSTLLELGYQARGPRRHKRFYWSAAASCVENNLQYGGNS